MQLYEIEESGAVVVTLSTGWKVECLPVARQLSVVGSSVIDPEEPKAPTYQMTGIGGATEERTHDAESIVDPKTTDAERVLWEAYLAQKEAWDEAIAANEAKRDEMKGRFFVLKGVRVRGLPADLEAWAEEQETLFGIPIEDEGLPRKLALLLSFVNVEVFGVKEDGTRIMAGILRASGMEQEAIDQIADMFRNSMGDSEKAGSDDAGDPGTPDDEEPAKE